MEPELLAELVNRHAPALTLYARQWCACPEDVVQNSFMKLAMQRVAPNRPIAWLFKVVRNGALDAARAARRRLKYETNLAESRQNWFEPSEDPTGLDAQAAKAALMSLPEENREITILHLWGELTFEEIANTVGGSATTCYRRYVQAMAMLRDKMSTSTCQSP
jgi:RNA polymerase sigma factor (sigma-70 family)